MIDDRTKRVVRNTVQLVCERFERMPNNEHAIRRFVYDLEKELESIAGIESKVTTEVDHNTLRGHIFYRPFDSNVPEFGDLLFTLDLTT